MESAPGLGAINQLTLADDGVLVSGSGIQEGRQDADAFIAKYSLAGEPLWSTWVRSDGTDSATGLFIQDNTIWVVVLPMVLSFRGHNGFSRWLDWST